MRRTSLVIALGLGLVACKKENGGSSAKAPRAADPATVAEADALWALAPKGAVMGGVITGKALTLFDRAAGFVRERAAAMPQAASVVEGIAEMRNAVYGTATGFADAGIALDRGAAWFGMADKTFITVVPVSDRAKFVATHGGTRDGDLDRLPDAVCKTIGAHYVCADDAATLVLGGGDLGKHAGVEGARGEVEIVATLPPLPPGAPVVPTGPLTIALGLSAGELVLRAHLPAKLEGPLAPFAASPRATIDPDRAGGFIIAPIGPAADAMPPQVRPLAGSLAGPVQVTLPAGLASGFALRVPLRDPAPLAKLLAACPPMGALPSTPVAGGCRIGPLPQLGVTLTLWVEGNELRGADAKGPLPEATATSPASAAGRELAGYTGALWGHGSLIGALPPGLPPELAPILPTIGYISELGIGAKLSPDGITGLLVARTIHANPDAVVAKLEALAQSGDRAGVEALAKANPGTPLASDVAAGPLGAGMPVMAVGIIAGVAIPAFMEYMRAGKSSESDLALNRIAKAAKVSYIRNGEFPQGKAGPTPKTSCCDGPQHECAPEPDQWSKDPVWSELEFAMDEPHRFHYTYVGTGKQFTATAEADLDCDGAGTTIVTARGSFDADGNPVVEFQKTGTD